MAFDGTTWDETKPDNDNVGHELDDYMRDTKIGVSGRMAREHMWPATQTATSQGGHHRYITFQNQTAAPSLSTALTMVGALYVTSSALVFQNSGGTLIPVVNASGAIPVIASGTVGAIPICSSANPAALTILAASTDGCMLVTHGTSSAPTWVAGADMGNFAPQYARPQAAATRIYWGSSALAANTTVSVAIGGTLSNTSYAVALTPNQAGNVNFAVNLTVGTKTTTTFRVDNEDGDVACAFTWIVIGSGT